MKNIAFAALLAAVGCGSSKKPAPSECEVSIGKGMDAYAGKMKSVTPNQQGLESRLAVLDKLRGALTTRCNEDKWGSDVVLCFTTVESMRDIQVCQARLSPEQRNKLMTDVRQVMMGMRGSSGMPPGMPGHPRVLGGSASGPGAPPPGGSAPIAPTPLPGASPSPGSAPPASSEAPPAGSAAAAPEAAPGATPPPSATAGSGTPAPTGGKLR